MALVQQGGGQVEENILQSLPPQDTQPLPQTGSFWDTMGSAYGSLKGGLGTGYQKAKEHRGKSAGICFALLALIAIIVVHAVYKGEGHSHAVPMDAPAGAKVCRDVTTLMADNGFTNYTLKQNFVEFGGEMILACPHRETEGDITITCSEEGEIALVNNQCLATDECS
eukprot:911074_1